MFVGAQLDVHTDSCGTLEELGLREKPAVASLQAKSMLKI